jgi:hypothetical protein
MAEDTNVSRSFAADIFAGTGVGLLLGSVIGLSVTPVVAMVVGALTSFLAVFLGLDGKNSTSLLPKVNAIRIGAFGFATVAGLALGLHARVNNPLAVDPSIALARWDAAFPDNPTLARQMMVYERTAIVPATLAFENSGSASNVTIDPSAAGAKQVVLFSALSEFDACARLDPERFATPADILAAYNRDNSPELVRAFGEQMRSMEDNNIEVALRFSHRVLCQMQDEGATE